MIDEIKRYKTVRHSNHKDLDDAVTKSLQSGWQPFGSPGDFEQRVTPAFRRCSAVAPQKLMEFGVHLFEFRPAQVRQLRDNFLGAPTMIKLP